MPCYEVRLVSVEFSMNSTEYLEKAATLSDLQFRYTPERDIMVLYGVGSTISLDLNTKQATIRGDWRGTQVFNKLKMKYSEVVISELAKKKKWLIKNKVDNKMTLRRY